MRPSRFQILHYDSAPVHMFSRCHNKEMYFQPNQIKKLYMSIFKESLEVKSTYKDKVEINAFCIMDNHYHHLIQYRDGAHNLSNLMRRCNGVFGQRYNRLHQRSGKVAESRPKTSLIENIEHTMQVHMYIEANPIRAGKCNLKQLKHYKYCSYGFYAHGIRNEFTSVLTIPEWYIALGDNEIQRQIRYRQLFENYLKESKLIKMEIMSYFIGSSLWVAREVKRYRKEMKEKNQNKDPV